MNFLTRFLKVFAVALVFSAIGAFVFYEVVMAGSHLRSDVSEAEFGSTVGWAIGMWLGFIIFLSVMLSLTGMKKTISVPVHDRNAFLHRVHQAITAVRYRPQSQTPDLLIYKPPIIGGVLAEKISVQLGQGLAYITAPRGLLKKIQARL